MLGTTAAGILSSLKNFEKKYVFFSSFLRPILRIWLIIFNTPASVSIWCFIIKRLYLIYNEEFLNNPSTDLEVLGCVWRGGVCEGVWSTRENFRIRTCHQIHYITYNVLGQQIWNALTIVNLGGKVAFRRQFKTLLFLKKSGCRCWFSFEKNTGWKCVALHELNNQIFNDLHPKNYKRNVKQIGVHMITLLDCQIN